MFPPERIVCLTEETVETLLGEERASSASAAIDAPPRVHGSLPVGPPRGAVAEGSRSGKEPRSALGDVTMMTDQSCTEAGSFFQFTGRSNLEPLGRRWRKRIMLIATVLVVLAIGGVVFLSPAVAAYVCPGCYGLKRVADSLFVDRAMSVEERTKLQETVARAAAQVAAFYGSFDQHPTLLVCATEECDRRLGGKGARAVTYGTTFIRLSPRGLNQTILAHELSHAELHARIGRLRLLTGALPAWFDEGLAVIVSDDARYLGPGTTSATRCLAEPDGDLPSGPFQWGPAAGKTPGLYAQAACRVMRWMEENGGPAGLRAAISQVADGTRRLP